MRLQLKSRNRLESAFSKTLKENYILLSRLDELKEFGLPLLVGTSRKSMIGRVLGNQPHERMAGTLATNLIAHQKGAQIFRVHDVKQHQEVFAITNAAQNPYQIEEKT